MQCAVIEFTRHVAGLDDANSEEFNPLSDHKVIYLMTEWFDFRTKNVEKRDAGSDKGGTMDIQMPVMNGYDASRHIRSSAKSDAKSVPIIAMVGRIYQGDLYATDINTLSLSVGQGNDTKNDKRLWLVRFTGSQLRELLAKANRTEIQEAIPNTPYYVASGLEITFAPWKEKKLVSVKKDGKELDPQATYTVALWGWPFKDPCKGTILKAFGESSEKILTEAIQEKGIISPPEPAGRFTLVY